MIRIFLVITVFFVLIPAACTNAGSLTAYEKTLPAAEVKSRIDAILSADEFKAAEHSPAWESLRQKVLDLAFAVMNYLARIWPDFELRPNRVTGVLGWTIAISAYLLGICVIGLLAYTIIQAGRRIYLRKPKEASPNKPEIAESRIRSPEEALSLASERAARGEFSDAYRAVYLAVLLALDSQRILEYIPSRTNWEYVRETGNSRLQPVLRELTGVFDRKVYGGERCTLADYERALQSYKLISEYPHAEDPNAVRA